ncbi:hypothetical protein [Ureaplasma ceti]|uniref:Uncharacterized protein n=1 Tax=Ureaplasma ceti TaxID=3119530 RepID=A0ABP9U4Q4_9BACT
MSTMSMKFERLGSFKKEQDNPQVIIKWIYFIAIICVAITSILGIVLIACKPQLYLISETSAWKTNIGFWNIQIVNFKLNHDYTATYASYDVTKHLSVGGIVYIALSSFNQFLVVVSFLLIRYLKSKNNIYHHMFSSWFVILFTGVFVMILVVGLLNHPYNQNAVYYQLHKTYKFNIIFSFNFDLVEKNVLGFHFGWNQGGIAFIGFVSALLFLLMILFIWFATKMLFRKPHYRNEPYYSVTEHDKEIRGLVTNSRGN